MIFLKRFRIYINNREINHYNCQTINAVYINHVGIAYFSRVYTHIMQKTQYKRESLSYDFHYRYRYSNVNMERVIYALYYDSKTFVHNNNIHHTIEQAEHHINPNTYIIRNIHCSKPKFALKKHIKRKRVNHFRNIQTIIYVNQTQRTITLGRLQL